MICTNVFERNIIAYNNKETLIINQGGTSSGKTYSILQLLYSIAYFSSKPLIISIVSYALPHLKLGAIRDFENILIGENVNIDEVKNKTDIQYKIGKCIIEFFSVDNLAKVHGPRRDILYINECNHIKYDIYTQLRIRTRGVTFLDYNPVREFWVNEQVIPTEKHSFIKSTYRDNHCLESTIVEQIESRQSNENWWRVYGLGEVGRLEDAILTNWSYGEFNNTLPYGYGLDFGSKHPDAMVKVAVDKVNKIIYAKEEIYKNGLSTNELISLIKSKNVGNSLIVADSASPRTIQDLRANGLNVRAVEKGRIVEDIKNISNYHLTIDENSYNLAKNLNNWLWLDKKGEIPIDTDDDLIDALRYYVRMTIKPFNNAPPRVTVMKS